MKKLISLLVLLAGTPAALAQGTVLFDNGVLVGRPEVTNPYVYPCLDAIGKRARC
jgi:hypothetical protein